MEAYEESKNPEQEQIPEHERIPEQEQISEQEKIPQEQDKKDSAEQGNPEPVKEKDPAWNAEGAVEAILFTMGDSVELNRLAAATGLTPSETKNILEHLKEKYQRPESGIQLLELDSAYQLCTKKQYYENLIVLAKQPKKPQLTDVVMETLSIIAYKQPVTKAEIEKIRGVSSDHAINKLLEYELIQELGRLNVPGRPLLFGTTEKFLRCFGVESTDQLPVLDEVQIEDFKAEAEAELDVQVDV